MSVGQLSFFSAETDEPAVDDLAGLLAANGHCAVSASGARLSIVVDAAWRAESLVTEIERCGIDADVARSEEGSLVVRTAIGAELTALNATWSRGAVKAMPVDWVPSARAQRLWVIAAGRPDADRYLLGLDPHARDTHPVLATALMRAGIAPTLVGTRGTNPALRIAGRRRLLRLVENIGAPPETADADQCWPRV